MNEEDIVIDVSKSFMDNNHYIVSAHRKQDDLLNYRITGVTYFDDGFLSRTFGIGRSFDEKLQQATCTAIKKLKDNIIEMEIRKQNQRELNDKAKAFAEKCFKKGV